MPRLLINLAYGVSCEKFSYLVFPYLMLGSQVSSLNVYRVLVCFQTPAPEVIWKSVIL